MRLLPTVHRDGAVDLVDLGRLGRVVLRTSALRVLLAAALAATLAGVVWVARGTGAGRVAVLPAGATTGCVALDMSASIYPSVYRRVSRTLRGLANSNQPMCLVMFSDTAYELVPPNSPAEALSPFVRYFKPGGAAAPSPWDAFRGGTRISRGLAVADEALQRAGVEHGSILLVSDLHDSSFDQSALTAEARRLDAEHVPVRIVSLFAVQADKQYFAGLFGWNTFADVGVFRRLAHPGVRPVAASAPWGLLTLGVVLVLLLFANERWNTRLAVEAT
jgi:hypothetical protein